MAATINAFLTVGFSQAVPALPNGNARELPRRVRIDQRTGKPLTVTTSLRASPLTLRKGSEGVKKSILLILAPSIFNDLDCG
jgi:hypothetical protein